jgi:hypothetical protein
MRRVARTADRGENRNMSDRRIRQLAQAARAGDVKAGVQLAYELRRLGALPTPEPWPGFGQLASLQPVPSYLATLSPETGPDVCLVPVGEEAEAVFVQVGPRQSRREDGLQEAVIGSGREHYLYAPCEDMRGVRWASPGGLTYELSASATFYQDDRGRWTSWGNVPVRFHFYPAERRRPRGYERIIRQTEARFFRRITRLVNEWAQDHPDAFQAPAQGIGVTDLSRKMRDLEQAQERVTRLSEEVSEEAMHAAQLLGY